MGKQFTRHGSNGKMSAVQVQSREFNPVPPKEKKQAFGTMDVFSSLWLWFHILMSKLIKIVCFKYAASCMSIMAQ
jgi:hypothetical protein